MKKNILNKATLFLGALCIILSGCASKKKAIPVQASSASTVTHAENVKAVKLAAAKAAAVNFSTISLRTKTDLAINGNRNDVTLNIRMKKDQAIWISVTAIAGLEVARALITPDSLKVLNRLESTYTLKPFSYLNEFSNKKLNFKMLQAILLGNPADEFMTEEADIKVSPVLQIAGALTPLTYQLVFSDRDKLVELNLHDQGQTLKVNYDDFTSINGRLFPQSVSIRSRAGNKNVAAELRYTRIDVNIPVEIPFSIPRRFTVQN